MITNDSRYVNAERLFAPSHSYTAQGKVDVTQEGKVSVLKRDTTYLLTTGQGPLPTNVKMVEYGDTIQSLGNEALQDPTKWWVVADANPQIRYPLDLAPGDFVRMPE